MQPNESICTAVNASPYTKTPSSSVMVGDRYCRKPIIFRGRSLAALVKG